LPPFPASRIQIEEIIMKFGQLINNSMQGEIMFHLSDPACGIRAIKFVHLNSRKMGVTMKGVGMKGHIMGRFLTFIM
jgi:hypothetical protein